MAFLKLLSVRNIAIWMVLLGVGVFITNVYGADKDSVHDLSQSISTASLIYIIVFLFGSFLAIFAYMAKRNIDALDTEVNDLKKSKEDYDDFKVEVAKTYISRDTLRDLVITPNQIAHDEIKERISQLMDLAAKAIMGG